MPKLSVHIRDEKNIFRVECHPPNFNAAYITFLVFRVQTRFYAFIHDQYSMIYKKQISLLSLLTGSGLCKGRHLFGAVSLIKTCYCRRLQENEKSWFNFSVLRRSLL